MRIHSITGVLAFIGVAIIASVTTGDTPPKPPVTIPLSCEFEPQVARTRELRVQVTVGWSYSIREDTRFFVVGTATLAPPTITEYTRFQHAP